MDTSWTHFTDRRHVPRLPLSLPLRYKVVKGAETTQVGEGKTCNVSSSGVLFEPDTPLDHGSVVELLVDWPALYHGKEPMKLVLRGPIIRLEEKKVALRVLYHDFIPYRFSETLPVSESKTHLKMPGVYRGKRGRTGPIT